MSSEIEETTIHIESSVNDLGGAENYLKCEFLSDSALDNTDSGSSTIPTSSDSEQSPVKQGEFISDEPKDDSENESNPVDGPLISTSTDLLTQNQTEHSDNIIPQTLHNISSAESNSIVPSKFGNHVNLPEHQLLTTSTVSLHEKTSFDSQNVNLKSPYSRSAENISVTDKTDTNETTSSNKELNKEKIITEFINQKSKASATQIVPESTTIDTKYPRLPKEILTQDLGSIYKNVHGIFSSVSGSLKNAYTQRNIYNVPVSKPIVKAKPVNTSRIMDDIFEDESEKVRVEEVYPVHTISETIVKENNEEVDPKTEMLRLQIESLEKLLQEQRKENMLLKERTKQQGDELQSKEQMFKEQEVKVDMMSKRVEQMEREKDAAVMRYASVECTAIEARKAADNAVKAEKAAIAEVELLNNKLKSAFNEKQRICQLYDDKCHDLQTCERETSKLREDFREMEGRLKWTQNKLRMEIDAYKESSERAEKLSQQVAELEAAREAAAVNASDSIRAKQLESDLKESRAALILCRHERDDLDRRLSSLSQQYESCRSERDDSISSLATANAQIAELREHNMRLEQEAAELAALRAQAALADTLSTQLQREIDRANQAEESLARERARAETCSRREAAALEHSARLTARDVAERAKRSDEEAKVQALSIDNTSLRERVSELERDSTRLKEALASETDARNRENRLLARKVAELTEELAEESKKLEWERGENAVLKKKHASAVKELNRELHRTLKRCETLEAKLTPPDASTRTGSVSSLSSGECPPTEEILQNGHSEVNPEIQVREPDRRALIERIVSLQRSLARRTERCEFLEEHSRQLTSALRGKARLLREVLPKVPAGAIVGEGSDKNKKEIARLGGGAMAAVWGGDPNGMTLELSLEMNKRLQAVLEDTLLKNITLKENMDTLGEEIARLKQKNVETK